MIWKENRENAYCEITPAILALKEQWEKKNYIDPRLYREYITPADGILYYRGIDCREIVKGSAKRGRFAFEEAAYLQSGPDRKSTRLNSSH